MSFLDVTLRLMDGFKTTCLLFLITLAAALPLGLPICLCSMSKFKPLKYLSKVFVWIIRGTPLMLQVILVFYGPGLIRVNGVLFREILGLSQFSSSSVRFGSVVVAFIINYAVYFSEIYRGGIESIPKGQLEAGQVLGMTKSQTFFKITLLQVVKRIVPPMSNEIITLVKDTSLARVIMVIELVKAAEEIVAQKGLIWPVFYIGAFYLLFCGLLTIVFNAVEKKLDYFKG